MTFYYYYIFLLLGGNLLFMYAMSTGFYTEHPQIIVFDFLYWVLLGPLLYLYIDLTTTARNRFYSYRLIAPDTRINSIYWRSGILFSD